MKRGKTRKNSNKYNSFDGNMFGGQGLAPSPSHAPPYGPNADNATVLSLLTTFAAEINDLKTLAETYKTKTDNLNNPIAMNEHLQSATLIQTKANAAYQKARDFWFRVYNYPWPEPAPAPAPPA